MPGISIPARAQHTASVIFAHGLGDSGAGWSFLPELMAAQKLLPGVKWILPNAPMLPVTVNMGMKMPAWYDIASLGDIDQRTEDEAGMLKSAASLHALVDEEIAGGLASNKVVLAGFSQGCAMALLAGLTCKKPLAAIVGMSGYLPLREKLPNLATEANKETPIWLAHGTADPVVNPKFGQLSQSYLKEKMGRKVEWQTYQGLAHSADPRELMDLAAFLKRVLA
ncbi:Phospholipase/carboxylesterase/thioesterase [Protomyces lactucae-debilis]|uniref:Acyl-protein thioesterase 1 n=1 Tax=Protomyces lactucae-debilis TaxID=2754530 RepID=A0A1Y2FWA4_PROLT|nr:Phospholipase/carboxylesterase/thioesterase [Protomyces lactucae-debilis]ORY86945.1 Phospholipase/carboxylesterase/thioesterase [Protomyces lactucae-debilis]